MREATFVFTCPSCGDPCAQTVEPSVDIHCGAGYTCDERGEHVIFEAMTVAEYMTYGDLLRQAHEAAKGGGKAL